MHVFLMITFLMNSFLAHASMPSSALTKTIRPSEDNSNCSKCSGPYFFNDRMKYMAAPVDYGDPILIAWNAMVDAATLKQNESSLGHLFDKEVCGRVLIEKNFGESYASLIEREKVHFYLIAIKDLAASESNNRKEIGDSCMVAYAKLSDEEKINGYPIAIKSLVERSAFAARAKAVNDRLSKNLKELRQLNVQITAELRKKNAELVLAKEDADKAKKAFNEYWLKVIAQEARVAEAFAEYDSYIRRNRTTLGFTFEERELEVGRFIAGVRKAAKFRNL